MKQVRPRLGRDTEEYRITLIPRKNKPEWLLHRRPIGTAEWLPLGFKTAFAPDDPEFARLLVHKPKILNSAVENDKLLEEMKKLEKSVLYSDEEWPDHKRLIALYVRFDKRIRGKYPITHYADERNDERMRLAKVYYDLWRNGLDAKHSKERFLKHMTTMQELTKKHPDIARLWAYMGLIQSRIGKREAAEVSLKKALGLDPKDPDYLAVRDVLGGNGK